MVSVLPVPHRRRSLSVTPVAIVALGISLLLPATARAQNVLGAHIGFALPIVTRTGDETTSIGDPFSIGFPTGITIKTSEKISFDVEFLPTIQREPYTVSLTFHPGIIYALPNNFSAGLRMAFDVNQASWGFTPQLTRKLRNVGTTSLFGELRLPLRFQDENNSIGVVVHLGLGF
jgi:hypothetical protein